MDSESELVSLISQIHNNRMMSRVLNPRSRVKSLISLMSQLISLVRRSLDLESQPKPEVLSLISQIVSLASSISISQPDRKLVSLATTMISLISSADPNPEGEPEPRLASLIEDIDFHLDYMDWNLGIGLLLTRILSVLDYMGPEPDVHVPEELISLFPQLEVRLERGKFRVTDDLPWKREDSCNLKNRILLRLTTKAEITHFFCRHCKGEKHQDCNKAPVEVKHPLHPRHSLHLVLRRMSGNRTCYCCDEYLRCIFYYCRACDCAVNIACVEKPLVSSVHHPRWHDHTLTLFPRHTFLSCNLCALPHSTSAFYICSPCEFVVHQECLTLPSVIKISRHLHRISFTPSFGQGNWSCGVCRQKIDNDYGGYSCIHNACFYAAHSKCATQNNIWDGRELEGTPEDVVEGVEPFLRISTGIIQHFSHQQHHLRLDDITGREYDNNMLCQACIKPIYFGNFYSCMECDFILHEQCANLSRKIRHPIHPHLLTLVTVDAGDRINIQSSCSACRLFCRAGFFYECGKEGCNFTLHVQCATISEPLVHGSHTHPLFLTSKPREWRICSICKFKSTEPFNCIECNFSLCFLCATIPQKVRYKHDKHLFTLSYGKMASTMTYWCEACERKIDPKDRFYTCDESCCVMLHTQCLIGDLYIKPGLLLIHSTGVNIDVLRNNHCLSRPICKLCKQRCPYNLVFQCSGFIFCSKSCILNGFWKDVIK